MFKKNLKICKSCEKPRVIFSKGLCQACAKIASVKVPKASKPTKPKLKPLPKLKKEARYWFQRWIRIRDLGNTCVYGSSSVLEDIRFYDACHYLKFELYPEAGFDEDNVHGGTKGENIRDNTIGYRRELIRRKGEEWVKNLEDKYCTNRQGGYKWDRVFLENILSKYKALCKELENNQ